MNIEVFLYFSLNPRQKNGMFIAYFRVYQAFKSNGPSQPDRVYKCLPILLHDSLDFSANRGSSVFASQRFLLDKKPRNLKENQFFSFKQKDTLKRICDFFSKNPLIYSIKQDGNSRKIEKKTNNPLNTSQNDDKNSNSNLSIPSLQNTANANRSLRQKSSKINYDRKYAEMETSPITSSMKNLKVSNENLRKVYKILLILKKNMFLNVWMMFILH